MLRAALSELDDMLRAALSELSELDDMLRRSRACSGGQEQHQVS
jgi:hypothetical protein